MVSTRPTARGHAAQRGAALLMVMIAVVIATVLSVTFLVSQGPSTAIASNISHHASARMIAESGLTATIEYIRDTPGWRSEQAEGFWLADHAHAGGSFRVVFEDEDGDLADDDGDDVVVTVVGQFGGVTHTVSARIAPGVEASAGNRLLFVAGRVPVSARDQRTIDLIENWGYVVTVIEDSDSQAAYDAAVAVNDVIYVSEECNSGSVAGKIDDAEIGIVNEETYLHDSLGFISGNGGTHSNTTIDITDNSHPITDGMSLGDVTLLTGSRNLAGISHTLAPGAQVLAERSGSDNAALLIMDTGAERIDSTPAPARRVALPFANSNFDPSYLNSDGESLIQRCLAWAAGDSAAVGGEPNQLVLYEFEEIKIVPNLVGHWKLDEANSLGGGGFASAGRIELKNGSTIEGYTSASGAYGGANVLQNAVVATNSTSSNRIKVASGTRISGDVRVGVGGNPASVVSNSGTITGTQQALDNAMDIDSSLSIPSGFPSNSGDKVITGSETLSSDRQYDKLEIKDGGRLTVTGDVRILCNDKFTVDNEGELVINSGASLTVYCKKEAEFKNEAEVNKDSQYPGNLVLVITTNHKLLIDNEAIVGASVFTEGEVEIKNESVFYGRLMAYRDVLLDNDARVRVDANLDSVTGEMPPLADSSTTENDGAYTVGGELGHNGALPTTGRSVRFDGDDDYAVVPHHDAYLIDAGAVSLWFKTEDRTQTQAIFSKDSQNLDTGGHLTVLIQGGVVRTRLQSATVDLQFTSGATVSNNTWHHLVFTWGPNKMRLYVDGVEVGQPYDYIGGMGTSSGDIGNYEPIVLGANAWNSDDLIATPVHSHFEGNIDDVRIYDQALDLTQVQNLQAGSDPGPSSFPGYIVEDTSGYGDPLHMTVQDTDAIAWIDGGGLTFNSATSVLSDAPAAKLHDALEATDQMTLEVKFTPANLTQDGPARIVTYSGSSSARSFTFGQHDDEHRFRLRTDDTGVNGTPDIESPGGLTTAEQHVVVTYDGANVKLYRNGSLETTEPRTGELDWDNAYHLLFGQEADGAQSWSAPCPA